jgi:hypothetical protein
MEIEKSKLGVLALLCSLNNKFLGKKKKLILSPLISAYQEQEHEYPSPGHCFEDVRRRRQ